MGNSMYIEDKLDSFITPILGTDKYKLAAVINYEDLATTIRQASQYIRHLRNNAEELEEERKAKYEVMKVENQKMGARSLSLELEVRDLRKELEAEREARVLVREQCTNKDGQIQALKESIAMILTLYKMLEAQNRNSAITPD